MKFAAQASEARTHAAAILGMEVRRFPVRKLIVMEALDIEREIFCSISFDAPRKCPLILFSAEGGVDIEELSEHHPDKLLEWPVNILEGPEGRRRSGTGPERAGLSGDLAEHVARAVCAMYERLLRP